jgi:hypothetical protein
MNIVLFFSDIWWFSLFDFSMLPTSPTHPYRALSFRAERSADPGSSLFAKRPKLDPGSRLRLGRDDRRAH